MSAPLDELRDRLTDALRASRDHDAYWGRASAGWRRLSMLEADASRGRYASPLRVLPTLRRLVADGVLQEREAEAGDPEFRWSEPVVPVVGARGPGGRRRADGAAVTPRAALFLRIPGEPRGQGRPRFARVGQGVRTYTPEATRSYAEQVQAEWIAAGRPRLVDGPYRLHVIAAMARPKGHLRADGSLSAAGMRAPRPTRKPDAANVAKLAEDALVAVGALPDDRLVVDLRAEKVWADREDGPHLVVYATSLVAELDGREAA